MSKKETYKRFVVVALFAIAMAFLEAVFVVYLRNLSPSADASLIHKVELAREAATIIMLACIGILAGRERYEKFAFFIYSFAIWDIFYYVFLKLTLNWPPSILTWDTLFLIPITWVGPVLAPVLVSATMIFFAVIIEEAENTRKKVYLRLSEEALLVGGCLVILFTFLYEYAKLLIQNGSQNLQQMLAYTPTTYNWTLFIVGEIIIFVGIALFYYRYKK